METNPIEGERRMGHEETPLYEENSRRLLVPTCFRIYDDRLEAYFFPYKYTVSYADIERVGIIEKIPWYVGWGLRFDPFDKKMYFAIHHGKSVEIEKKSGCLKKVVLSVERPEKFLAAVNEWFSGRHSETEKRAVPLAELK